MPSASFRVPGYDDGGVIQKGDVSEPEPELDLDQMPDSDYVDQLA